MTYINLHDFRFYYISKLRNESFLLFHGFTWPREPCRLLYYNILRKLIHSSKVIFFGFFLWVCVFSVSTGSVGSGMVYMPGLKLRLSEALLRYKFYRTLRESTHYSTLVPIHYEEWVTSRLQNFSFVHHKRQTAYRFRTTWGWVNDDRISL